MERRVSFSEWEGSGRLLAFCGIDGAGKTSVISEISQRLRRANIVVDCLAMPSAKLKRERLFADLQRSPREETRGRIDFLAFSLMVMADRLQMCAEEVLPSLKAGRWVLLDRFVFTGLAEAIARHEEDRLLYSVAARLPRPDLTVLLDVSPELARQRVISRPAERFAFLDYQLMRRMRQGYRELALENDVSVVVSDGELSQTVAVVWSLLMPLLCGQGPRK